MNLTPIRRGIDGAYRQGWRDALTLAFFALLALVPFFV